MSTDVGAGGKAPGGGLADELARKAQELLSTMEPVAVDTADTSGRPPRMLYECLLTHERMSRREEDEPSALEKALQERLDVPDSEDPVILKLQELVAKERAKRRFEDEPSALEKAYQKAIFYSQFTMT